MVAAHELHVEGLLNPSTMTRLAGKARGSGPVSVNIKLAIVPDADEMLLNAMLRYNSCEFVRTN